VSDTLEGRTVAVPTGLGHTAYGRFATGRYWGPGGLGGNPVTLLPGEPDAVSGGLRWGGVRVKVTKTRKIEKLASPAGVTEVDHEREIFETIPMTEALEAARAGTAPPHANLPSMYPDLKYPEHAPGHSLTAPPEGGAKPLSAEARGGARYQEDTTGDS